MEDLDALRKIVRRMSWSSVPLVDVYLEPPGVRLVIVTGAHRITRLLTIVDE